MEFYSTLDASCSASLIEALTQGFAPGGGLYVPSQLPFFSKNQLLGFRNLSFPEISYEIAKRVFVDLDAADLLSIIEKAFDFPLPLLTFPSHNYGLELFHGPTFSFKDVGARFLAELLQFLWNKPLLVLVATTGDTGSAVGNAFLNKPGVEVCILYPKGKVTPSQEKQLTTIGGNVKALEIDGSFDDCQRLLKEALSDSDLQKKQTLTTGNSINVGRILPQSFYFIYAFAQMPQEEFVVSVPCGNFGHLVSAILAKKMGLPICHFLAGTNRNDEVPLFLKTGIFQPHVSWQTITVSMDVGNPSNFPRLCALYSNSLSKMRGEILGESFSDEEVKETIVKFYRENGYLLDPHTAIGFASLEAYRQVETAMPGLFLATAHPAKFVESIEPLLSHPIEIPASLKQTLGKPKKTVALSHRFEEFKSYLMSLQ